jgi:hypothetical protein
VVGIDHGDFGAILDTIARELAAGFGELSTSPTDSPA